jgi:hypothetical protein
MEKMKESQHDLGKGKERGKALHVAPREDNILASH